jgi:hypothetical protein
MKLPIWQKCILPGVLLILVVLTYWPVFSSAKLPGGELSDTVNQGYPFLTFTEEAVRNGRIPHWNPYIFCGIPFYSSFSAPVFYPVRGLLLLAAGPEGVARFLFPIHMLFGGIFAWLFLRSIGVSKWGRIVGALAFACTSWSNTLFYAGHASKIICWSFLPLLLYSCEKWMQTRRGKFIAIGGLALGMQALASHPQMILYSSGAALIWLGFRTFSSSGSWKTNTLKALMGFSIIVLFAVAIGAVQLLPGYNFSKYSTRGDGLSFDQAASYSLPPEETLTMLFPHLFGYRHGFPDSMISGVPYYYGRLGLRLSSEFTGIAVFLLALAAFLGSKKRYRWPLLAIMVTGLLISWGGYTLIFGILYRIIPFFRKLRAPHMAAFLTTSAIALAAGPGFDSIFGKDKFPEKNFLKIIAIFAGICICVYLLAGSLLPGLQSGWWNRMGNPGATGYSFVVQRRVDLAAPDFLKAAGAAFVLGGLLYFKKHLKGRLAIPGIALTALLAIETIPIDRDFQVYLPETNVSDLFSEYENLSNEVGSGRILPGGNEFVPLHIRSVTGYHAAKPAVAEDLQSILSSGGIFSFRQTAYTVLQADGGNLTYDQVRNTLLNQASIEDPASLDTLRILIPENPLSRTWFADSWIQLTEEQCMAALASGINLQDISILYENPGLPELIDSPDAEASIVVDEPERVIIHTSNVSEGLLILADTWYPRWQVRIDGEPASMLQANHWQRGVCVPAGSHVVEFSFDSSDFSTGLLISIAGLICAILLIVLDLTIRRKRKSV